MSDIPQKCCTGPCGEEKPATLEFFHRDKRAKNGLKAQCKSCASARCKAYNSRPDIQERRKSRWNTYYSSPEAREHERQRKKVARSRPEVRERDRVWWEAYYSRPEVKEHHRAYDKVYGKGYRSRPGIREHRQAQREAYRSRPEIQEQEATYRKIYYSRPEVQEHYRNFHRRPEIQSRNRDLKKIYYSRPEVKERWRVHGHKRRAKKKSIPGTHSPAQIQEMLKRHRYRCYYCRTKLRKNPKFSYGYEFHIEHTFPISRVAGTDIPANDISYLVPACKSCNSSKHDKFPWEWPEGGRLL